MDGRAAARRERPLPNEYGVVVRVRAQLTVHRVGGRHLGRLRVRVRVRVGVGVRDRVAVRARG